MTEISGNYTEIDGLPVVRFERTFPHTIANVWAAVTDSDQLEAWFPTSVEFSELAVGAPIEFRFAGDAYPPMSGAIKEIDPPHRLEFSWGDDVLTFELSERDDGRACRLRFSVILDAAGKAARDSAGWEECLDRLAESLAGSPRQRPSGNGHWREYYDEYRRRGLPATAEIPQ